MTPHRDQPLAYRQLRREERVHNVMHGRSSVYKALPLLSSLWACGFSIYVFKVIVMGLPSDWRIALLSMLCTGAGALYLSTRQSGPNVLPSAAGLKRDLVAGSNREAQLCANVVREPTGSSHELTRPLVNPGPGRATFTTVDQRALRIVGKRAQRAGRPALNATPRGKEEGGQRAHVISLVDWLQGADGNRCSRTRENP